MAMMRVVSVWGLLVDESSGCNTTVTEATPSPITSTTPFIVAAALGICTTPCTCAILLAALVPAIIFVLHQVDWHMFVMLVVPVRRVSMFECQGRDTAVLEATPSPITSTTPFIVAAAHGIRATPCTCAILLAALVPAIMFVLCQVYCVAVRSMLVSVSDGRDATVSEPWAATVTPSSPLTVTAAHCVLATPCAWARFFSALVPAVPFVLHQVDWNVLVVAMMLVWAMLVFVTNSGDTSVAEAWTSPIALPSPFVVAATHCVCPAISTWAIFSATLLPAILVVFLYGDLDCIRPWQWWRSLPRSKCISFRQCENVKLDRMQRLPLRDGDLCSNAAEDPKAQFNERIESPAKQPD